MNHPLKTYGNQFTFYRFWWSKLFSLNFRFVCFWSMHLQATCCICLRGDLSATLFSVFKDSKNWRLSQLTATFSPWGICFVACSCFFCPNSTNQLFFADSLKCHRNLFLPRPSEIIFGNLIWRRLSVKPASFLNSFRVFYSPGLLVFSSRFTCLPMLLSQPSFLLPPPVFYTYSWFSTASVFFNENLKYKR